MSFMDKRMKEAASEQLKRDLFQAIDAFAALQQKQLRGIAGAQADKIRAWRANREREFARLRSLLEGLHGGDGGMDDPEFRNSFLKKMQQVLAGETDLRDRFSQLQGAIGNQLQTVRRGKQALHGYGRGEKGKLPRFVSSRT